MSEEGLHSTSLGVCVPLATLDQNLQVAQKRSLLRGWIPDPPPARPLHWWEESQKLSPSFFFFFFLSFLGEKAFPKSFLHVLFRTPEGYLRVEETVLETTLVCVALAVPANLLVQFA